MEPFCVILTRTLSSAHPLHQMLKYHCRDVTVPNTIGAPKLLDEGQIVDELFASGNKGATRLLTKAHPLTTWDVTDFKNEIRVCDASVSLSIFDAKNMEIFFGQAKRLFKTLRHGNKFALTRDNFHWELNIRNNYMYKQTIVSAPKEPN